MSITVKNYTEVSRSFLLKVIEKQKENIETYPVSLFNKNLEDDLKKTGFFDEYKKVLWWRQEICPKNISLRIYSNPRICRRLMRGVIEFT